METNGYEMTIINRVYRITLDAVADTAKTALDLQVAELIPPLKKPSEYNDEQLKDIFQAFHECFAERAYFCRMLMLVKALVSGYGKKDVNHE